MILRRLIGHLKQQHWTAAVIELLIVVLGVFIGMQVSNWNEQRRDRALARHYLERLHEDFVLSARAAEDSIESLEDQTRRASMMLDRLRECRLDDSQRAEFARGLFRLGRLEPPMLVRGTIDELQSTGRVGIISVKLRKALSNILQRQDRTRDVFGFIVERRTQQLAYVDARSTFLVPLSEMGSPRPEQILFDFPALCRDPAYINAVSHLRQAVYTVIRQHQRLLEQYRALVKLLDAELSQAPR